MLKVSSSFSRILVVISIFRSKLIKLEELISFFSVNDTCVFAYELGYRCGIFFLLLIILVDNRGSSLLKSITSSKGLRIMSTGLKKPSLDGCENSLSPELQQGKVSSVSNKTIYVHIHTLQICVCIDIVLMRIYCYHMIIHEYCRLMR